MFEFLIEAVAFLFDGSLTSYVVFGVICTLWGAWCNSDFIKQGL